MSNRAPGQQPLAALLGPTSAADFAAEVWSRGCLVRRADDGADLTGLFTLSDADDLLSSRALRTPFLRIAKDGSVVPASSFTRSGGIGATIADQVDPDQVTGLLADGSTLVFQGLHRAWQPVQEFTTALVSDLGHAVQANAYLTPSNARGFAAHYDTHDVFVVQLAGTKHWTIHPPVFDIPAGLDEWTQHRADVATAAEAEPAFNGALEPGDVMYLPRGWIHSATAGGTTSLHLTLGVHPYTERHVLDAVIAEAMDGLRVHGSLPAGIDVADPADLTTTMADMRQLLIGALAGVKADNVAERMARRRSGDVRPDALRPVAQVAAAESQSTGSPATVRLRRGFPPRLEERSGEVDLVLDNTRLTFASADADALRHILTAVEVQAASLPGLDDVTARDLIRRLLLAGVVVPVVS